MQVQAPDWLDVSRETQERLEIYVSEVLRWNPAVNLISKTSAAEIWQRHVWDSAQLMRLTKNDGGLWLDIGSGGGFPAVVLAVLGVRPMTLIESDQRKAAFLREIGRQLDLTYTVLSQRVEALPPMRCATISARALTSLTGLLAHANRHLVAGGRAIFPKGRTAQDEISEAQQKWRFDLQMVPSKTDQDASILIIENIELR